MKMFALGLGIGALLMLATPAARAQDGPSLPPIFQEGGWIAEEGGSPRYEILEVRGDWVRLQQPEGRGLARRIGSGTPVPRWVHVPTGTVWLDVTRLVAEGK
jgi:hypothetical protein